MTGFSASLAQRMKVQGEPCRICLSPYVDPAHIIARGSAHGGCDDADCVLPLCRTHHHQYDRRTLDILPYLTKTEQAHAVGHAGIIGALERSTNVRWSPNALGEAA